jgi:hypothetical protein
VGKPPLPDGDREGKQGERRGRKRLKELHPTGKLTSHNFPLPCVAQDSKLHRVSIERRVQNRCARAEARGGLAAQRGVETRAGITGLAQTVA